MRKYTRLADTASVAVLPLTLAACGARSRSTGSVLGMKLPGPRLACPYPRRRPCPFRWCWRRRMRWTGGVCIAAIPTRNARISQHTVPYRR